MGIAARGTRDRDREPRHVGARRRQPVLSRSGRTIGGAGDARRVAVLLTAGLKASATFLSLKAACYAQPSRLRALRLADRCKDFSHETLSGLARLRARKSRRQLDDLDRFGALAEFLGRLRPQIGRAHL